MTFCRLVEEKPAAEKRIGDWLPLRRPRTISHSIIRRQARHPTKPFGRGAQFPKLQAHGAAKTARNPRGHSYASLQRRLLCRFPRGLLEPGKSEQGRLCAIVQSISLSLRPHSKRCR